MTDPEKKEERKDAVQLERLVPGPIERVWEELTHPDHLGTWLGADEGVVTHCDPPQRLSYTGNDNASEVTVELEPRGDDVLLRLTHRRTSATARLAA